MLKLEGQFWNDLKRSKLGRKAAKFHSERTDFSSRTPVLASMDSVKISSKIRTSGKFRVKHQNETKFYATFPGKIFKTMVISKFVFRHKG